MIVVFAISLLIMLGIVFGASLFMEDARPFTITLFLVLVFCAFCFYAGRKSVQQEAVIAGAAEYRQVVKDGEVSNDFVWKKSN